MKRIILLGSLFFLTQSWLFSQNDSLTLVSANWNRKKIASHVIWKKYHFKENELFKSNLLINFIEINPASKKIRFKIAYSDSLETTSQLAKKKNALAAINGSFFKMRGADPDYNAGLSKVPKTSPSYIGVNRSVVYLRVNDSLIAKNVISRTKGRQMQHQGAILINKQIFLVLKADSAAGWEDSLEGDCVLTSGPVLLSSGKCIQLPDNAFCNNKHPRTAVGIKADRTIIFLVVDGRTASSYGLSLSELQKILKWMNCEVALNLDGGGSSTMYIRNQPFNGVVNCPSDNRKFDHEGEREIANAILILTRKQKNSVKKVN